MSLIFFDGFDFYIGQNNFGFGPGGRKWDTGSIGQTSGSPDGTFVTGRFGGQGAAPMASGFNSGLLKTLPASYPSLIMGFAMKVDNYNSFNGVYNGTYPSLPFLTFYDQIDPSTVTAQCSVWIDPVALTLKVMTGRGTNLSDYALLTTNYSPPLTLWFYLEIAVTFGNTGTGAVELRVNGQSLGSVTNVQTQQSGNASCNKFGITAFSGSNSFITGQWTVDDLYVVDPSDSTGAVTYLGEVRVQTMYPDAEGYQDDFQPSTGIVNANNVNSTPTNYSDNGKYNYSGTVGAIDLYSVGNFTVSGTIFGVQENIAFRKDDVGNRDVAPIVRTSSVNYVGTPTMCYSSFTWAGQIWEYNPNTNAPWDLTDLNLAEFGIKITS